MRVSSRSRARGWASSDTTNVAALYGQVSTKAVPESSSLRSWSGTVRAAGRDEAQGLVEHARSRPLYRSLPRGPRAEPGERVGCDSGGTQSSAAPLGP